jgi:hypothetical protein
LSSRPQRNNHDEKQQQGINENDEKAGWKTTSTYNDANSFNLQRGIRVRAPLNKEIDFFTLFIDDAVLNSWVAATNNNANNTQHRQSWKNTNLQEMKHFLAVIIYMGIHKSPQLHDYWSELSGAKFVQNVFPRHRFCEVFDCFYMNSSERNPVDRIWHVRPLVDHLKRRFKECYQPSRVLVVDESMCHTKARLAMKQYVPAKPYKWGIKI